MAGADPWAAPPTPDELGLKAQKQKPTGPSVGGPSILDLLQRGAEWAASKDAEATKDSPRLALLTRMMGMGAMRGMPSAFSKPVPSGVQPPPEPPVQPSVQIQPAGTPQPSGAERAAGIVDWLMHPKVKLASSIKDILLKKAAPTTASYPESNWSATAPPATAGQGAPAPAMPPEAPPPAPPVVQAPPPEPPPMQSFGVSDLTPATQARMQQAMAPPPEPPINIFERAARSKKVAELTKAIDANASAHLGVDPTDPRFGEALQALPPEWWEGMSQVAKINKPSASTIDEVLKFYRDRSSKVVK